MFKVVLTINGVDYDCDAYHPQGSRLWYYTRSSVAAALIAAKRAGLTTAQLRAFFTTHLTGACQIVERIYR